MMNSSQGILIHMDLNDKPSKSKIQLFSIENNLGNIYQICEPTRDFSATG